MPRISIKGFREKTEKYVSRATILGVAVLLFVLALPLSVSAATVWGTGTAVGTLTLQQTGSCCSGADNFRFWTQYYPDVPAALSFDKVRFQASTTVSTIQVYVVVNVDVGGDITTVVDGYTSLYLESGDTNVLFAGPYTATRVGDIFTASLPSPISVGSGNYFELLFSQTGTIAPFVLETSDGVGMYRTVSGSSPAPYEGKTERVKIELCVISCDGDFGSFVYVPYSLVDGLLVAPGVHNTRFTSFSVSGTSSPVFSASYFLDLAEIDSSVSALNPTAIRFRVASSGSAYESARSVSINNTVAGTSTEALVYWETPLDDGSYTVAVDFSNTGCSIGLSACPFSDTYAYLDFIVSSGAITSSTTPEIYFPGTTVTVRPCGLADIGGCIINATQYLIYPSTESLANFSSELQILEYKVPFVYAYQASDLMTGLFTGTTDVVPTISYTTGIGEITWLSQAQIEAIPFVDLLRSLMAGGLWIMLYVILYRKTLAIHDKVTV